MSETLSGERLYINAETRGNQAFVAAEVVDSEDKVVKGFSKADCDRFKGNELCHEMTWKGRSLSELKGGSYAFRFILRHSSLYSYGFES